MATMLLDAIATKCRMVSCPTLTVFDHGYCKSCMMTQADLIHRLTNTVTSVTVDGCTDFFINLDDWRPSPPSKVFRVPSKWREEANKLEKVTEVGLDEFYKIKAHIKHGVEQQEIERIFKLNKTDYDKINQSITYNIFINIRTKRCRNIKLALPISTQSMAFISSLGMVLVGRKLYPPCTRKRTVWHSRIALNWFKTYMIGGSDNEEMDSENGDEKGCAS